MQIKNLIFDLGQVLLNLNFDATKAAFEALGFKNHALMFGKYSGSQAFHNFETGHLSENEFYNEVRKVSAIPQLTDAQILHAWNAMLGDIPQIRLQLLESLSSKYRLFLFSNTNVLHYNFFTAAFINQHNKTLNSFFKTAYYSHILGCRKPNASSFTKILQLENLQAAETLFMDDGEANIEGAKQVGLQTLLITPSITIENTLLNYLQTLQQ